MNDKDVITQLQKRNAELEKEFADVASLLTQVLDENAKLAAPRLIRTVWRPVKKPAKGKKFQVVERSYQMRQVLDPNLYNHQIRIETYRRLDETLYEVEIIEGIDEYAEELAEEIKRRELAPKNQGTRRPY